MLKIYTNPLSAPSNKVLFCAHALELEFEQEFVDLASAAHLQKDYLEIHPFAKVPVIVDDKFRLYESGAIIRYLARAKKSSLYPSTFEERALVDQWCDLSTHSVQLAIQKVYFNKLLAPMLGQAPDENAIKQGLAQLAASLPVIDEHLNRSAFLVGNDLTLADISLLSVLDIAEAIEYDLGSFVHLSRWRNNLMKQPFYLATHAYFGEGVFAKKG